jgi:sporulation protein YlmC with PRC-barrel domain
MRSMEMHTTLVAGVLSLWMAVAAVPVGAQVAGSTKSGMAPDEVKTLARGWSAKKQILGKAVYNDQDEKVGEVEDLIVTPDKSLSYAIIGVGGFLGVGTYTVAIPVGQFQSSDGKIVLPGVTKDTLKAMPSFEYSQ